jgi:hypothetical protein
VASFESTRAQFSQEHFEVIEIDLPVITGACTIGGSGGFGTPLTCDQAYTGEIETYYFTNENAPLLTGGNTKRWRVVKSISETPTELKPGEGLSSRGTITIVLNDFKNQDPNPNAPGVDADVVARGTFLGKLDARQVMVNKPIRVKLHRVEDDGTIDLSGGALTRHYIVESFTNNGNGTWSIKGKDELSVANLTEKTWPQASGGYLRQDIDDSVTVIPVDGETDYSSAVVVRVGDEFMAVNSVTGNLTGSAVLNVGTRGLAVTAPVSGATLTRTDRDSHSGGDEVFICRISDNERIDDLLSAILTDSDIDPARIPSADWQDEVDEWHATTLINTLWYKSEKVNDALKRVLGSFLMDMWSDPEDREIKLSAISVWKQSAAQLTEGREITYDTIKVKQHESMRATRALAVYNKPYLGRSDDVENYNKASTFKDDTLIVPELFGEHKDKLFPNSQLLSDSAADLLVQRYVSRFKFAPEEYTFKTPERLLGFKVGDVVDLDTSEKQAPDGSNQGQVRAQVTKIKPDYRKDGRDYSVSALAYEAAFQSGSEIVITGAVSEINLYVQYAGAPSQPVDLTFVFDGANSGSGSQTPSIRAGNFPAGSKLIIILANGADLQAKGGNGATSRDLFFDGELGSWQSVGSVRNGGDGGTVFDADGVDCDIYFSGSTPSTAYPTADGYIRAPGGGGGQGLDSVGQTDAQSGYSGNAGGGGAGRTIGSGGSGGALTGGSGTVGQSGVDGSTSGTGGNGGTGAPSSNAGDGGDWGQPGGNGAANGGDAGSGIIDSGGTVVLFGSTAARYINGNGDHP